MRVLRVVVLGLVAALGGCASAPEPISYYLLSPPVAITARSRDLENRPTLVIEDVKLAEYLRQSGLVMQQGNNEVVVSRSHLWAESLDQAVPRTLLRQLQERSSDYDFCLKPSDCFKQSDFRLRLSVDSLQATDTGEVVTAGRYQLISSAEKGSTVFKDFYFRRDLDDDGYSYAVEQLQVLVGEIADAVLASLNDVTSGRREQGTN